MATASPPGMNSGLWTMHLCVLDIDEELWTRQHLVRPSCFAEAVQSYEALDGRI